jgi:hypothetical protein
MCPSGDRYVYGKWHFRIAPTSVPYSYYHVRAVCGRQQSKHMCVCGRARGRLHTRFIWRITDSLYGCELMYG